MASSIVLPTSILSLILFHLLFVTQEALSASISTPTAQTSFRVTLTRSDSRKKLTKNRYHEPLRDAENKPDSLFATPLKMFKDEYVMNLAIGTPPVQFSVIMDTGSNLIWTDKCKPQPSLYSSSFHSIDDTNCDYFGLDGCRQNYDDGTSVDISLAYETFAIGKVKIPNVIFGCGIPDKKHNDYDGVVGMGRGKLSLVSQLKQQVFAYCLASRFEESKTSVLLTGSKASSAVAKADVQTMPLLTNNANGYESNYYIPLEGISVGETRLPVTTSDFIISNEGGGGMIIDSGSTFTYLEQRIVDMIESEFMNQTKFKKITQHPLYQGLNVCFNSPSDPKIIPKMVFHFKGANLELPRENYVYERSGRACLGFMANDDKEKESIFGNMQQQNMMMLYDLEKSSLSFWPANCNQF